MLTSRVYAAPFPNIPRATASESSEATEAAVTRSRFVSKVLLMGWWSLAGYGRRSAVDRLDDTQPTATPAQPALAVGDDQNPLSLLESVVSLTFASWNQIAGWLRQLDGLREAA